MHVFNVEFFLYIFDLVVKCIFVTYASYEAYVINNKFIIYNNKMSICDPITQLKS